MDTFEKRLTTAMFRCGMTQSALAEKVGVSRGAVNHWTKGEYISPENLVRVAIALGVDSHWLRTGEEPPELPTTRPQAPKIEASSTPLLEAISKLLPEQVEELERIVEGMSEKNRQTLSRLLLMYGKATPDSRVEEIYGNIKSKSKPKI